MSHTMCVMLSAWRRSLLHLVSAVAGALGTLERACSLAAGHCHQSLACRPDRAQHRLPLLAPQRFACAIHGNVVAPSPKQRQAPWMLPESRSSSAIPSSRSTDERHARARREPCSTSAVPRLHEHVHRHECSEGQIAQRTKWTW
jgi:hypothetical protein